MPSRIVYQGRLTKSGVSVAGDHVFIARFLSAAGLELWSSSDMTVNLPITGDFTLVLEPTNVDWVADDPQLEITIDGERLSPNDTFAATPYALVASTALTVLGGSVGSSGLANGAVTDAKVAVNAGIQASKIAISGSTSLADWRSPSNPMLIDPAKVGGNAPIGANTVDSNAVINGSLTRSDVSTASFQAAGAGLVPPGAILMIAGQNICPAGYAEITALRNRFPLGADLASTDPDVPDGANALAGTKFPDHAHTHGGTTDVTTLTANHSHTIADSGTHSHSTGYAERDAATEISNNNGLDGRNGHYLDYSSPTGGGHFPDLHMTHHTHSTNAAGDHNHGGTTGTTNADISHSHTFTTGEMSAAPAAHIPPALTVLFCSKT